FDRFEIASPGPVVAFTGEGTADLYLRRLRHVGRSMGMGDNEIERLPIFITSERATTRSEIFQRSLGLALRNHEPVKVSLDPLYAYHGADVEASNVHSAAEVLNAVSEPTQEAGASLKVVNHFRKDVGRALSLTDITQAGGREWCDSWTLVRQRRRPDLETNEF